MIDFPGTITCPNTNRSGNMFFMQTPDLCDGGELFDLVCPKKAPWVRPFNERTARRLFRQFAGGLAHMHKFGCYHRDLKLENIVLTRRFELKIMDFGFVKFADQIREFTADNEDAIRRETTTKVVGTKQTNPPEVRLGKYDPAAFDVWGAGVILFFLIAGDRLHTNIAGKKAPGFQVFAHMVADKVPRDMNYLFDMLSKATDIEPGHDVPSHPKFWQHFQQPIAGYPDMDTSGELKDLINRILDLDPVRRITMAQILEHPWLQGDDEPDDTYQAEMETRYRDNQP